MAEVYVAVAQGASGFEKRVAIKRIHPHLSSSREFVAMLVEEAKLSVSLTHRNIAQTFDPLQLKFGPEAFNGALDEAMIFNRALDQSEIQQLMGGYRSLIPEPGSLALLVFGGLLTLRRRR